MSARRYLNSLFRVLGICNFAQYFNFLLELTYQYVHLHYVTSLSVLYTWMNGSAAVAARQCRAVPAFSVALVLPSLYYIEAEVESGCYCNEDTMCSIQPLLGACKKFCSHTTTTTSSLSLLQLYFSLSLLIWYNICTYLPIYIYIMDHDHVFLNTTIIY